MHTFRVVCSMSRKIFFTNFPDDTNEDEMRKLFQQYGKVTECVIIGSFGFVVSIAKIIIND